MTNIETFGGATTGTTDGFSWSVGSDNTITITGYTPPVVTTIAGKTPNLITLIIPSTLNSKPVTVIGPNAFSGKTNFNTVNIPSSVITIGLGAFSGCTPLRYVSFTSDSKLTTIDANAFSTTNVNNPIIPETVKTIGDGAFRVLNDPAPVLIATTNAGSILQGIVSVRFLGNCPAFTDAAFVNNSAPATKIIIYCYEGKTGFDKLSDHFTVVSSKLMTEPTDTSTFNPIYPLLMITIIILILIFAAAKLI